MKAPEFRPFVKEDFSEAPWMDRLIRPLNSVLGQLRAGMDGGLTLGDNLNAEIKTIDIGGGRAAVAVGDDAAWRNVGEAGQPAWVTGTNVGAPYISTRFRRAGGIVHVQVAANATSGAVLFVLPEGYRPAAEIRWPCMILGAGAAHGSVAVDGSVSVIWTGQAVSGVSFPADDVPAGVAASSAFPVKLSTTVSGKIAGVLVLAAYSVSGRSLTAVSGIGGVGWDQDGSTIILRGVTGLNPGATYRLTLAVIGA